MKKITVILTLFVLGIAFLNAYEVKTNTGSNVLYYNTNYGINGYDVQTAQPGIFWPRNSSDYYQSGAGIAFAAKVFNNDGSYYTTVSQAFNSMTARYQFVPGSNEIDATKSVCNNPEIIYPLYLSSDYNLYGTRNDYSEPIWPLWKNNSSPFGDYVTNTTARSLTYYPYGPKFMASESMVSIYKDSDPDIYSFSSNNQGTPLNLQVEEKTLFWDESPLNDVVLVIYTITNMSDTDYKDATFAKLFDIDIASYTTDLKDRAQIYSDASKRMVYCWTDLADGPEGYMALSLVLSPQVGSDGYPIENDSYNSYSNGLKLATAFNFDIGNNLDTRLTYEALTSNTKAMNSVPNDQRVVLASESFNLKPGQTVSFGVAQIFGNAVVNGNDVKASGQEAELSDILYKWNALYNKIYVDQLKVNTSITSGNISTQENTIYPNPTAGIVNINLPGNEVENLTVYDIYGKQVYQSQDNSKSINLEHLSDGVYYLQIQEGNKISTHKVVLNK